jgi:hypothetical protein
MIGMKMRQQDDIDGIERQTGLSQAGKTPRTGIHENTRDTIDQDQMTGRRTPQSGGAAGPQNHQFQRRGRGRRLGAGRHQWQDTQGQSEEGDVTDDSVSLRLGHSVFV